MKETAIFEADHERPLVEQVVALNRPTVLRGFVQEWPAVVQARESPQSIAQYVTQFSDGQPVSALFGKPEILGRFFYNEDFTAFNFEKQDKSLDNLFAALLDNVGNTNPPALYAGAVSVSEHLPGFLSENSLNCFGKSINPLASLWVGNRIRMAAHWDLPHNILCVIRGRRRFTLFPTEQLKNLYIGPLDLTLGGRPISLVDFHLPDFRRYPRFRDAIAQGEVAELVSGDALYIPSLWLHHAESFDPLSVMMNFWWRDAPPYSFSPHETMLHALLTVRGLPEAERKAWRVLFDYYIFQTDGEPMSHLPVETRGIFGTMTSEIAHALMADLEDSLRRRQATPSK